MKEGTLVPGTTFRIGQAVRKGRYLYTITGYRPTQNKFQQGYLLKVVPLSGGAVLHDELHEAGFTAVEEAEEAAWRLR